MTHGFDRLALTRRRALKLAGATLGTSLALELPLHRAVAAESGADGRSQTLSFDDRWRFSLGTLDGAEAPAYDDGAWRTLDVPHDWSIEDLPGGSTDSAATRSPNPFDGDAAASTAPSRIGPFDRNASAGAQRTAWTVGGEGWYRKRFTPPAIDMQQRIELRFDGVQGETDVWLNGVHLGFHAYGYTPFSFDITSLLQAGSNVLAVRVRNLGSNSRWYAGAGIYRHTWLQVSDRLHVPQYGVAITTPSVSSAMASVAISTTLSNLRTTTASVQLRTTVLDAAGVAVATNLSAPRSIGSQTTDVSDARFSIPAPALWSPATPVLYRCLSEVLVDGVVIDAREDRFGIRSIAFDAQGFRLNGDTMKLRGTNIHHDHGPLGAVSLDRSEERRIEILKAAGFNAVRLAHNPHNPRLLDICDRLGMLVYSELFDMWDQPKSGIDSGYYTYFADTWQQDLETWVVSERNHPCVIVRSIGNEINGSQNYTAQQVAARGAELAAAVRTLDPTRPVCMGGGQSITQAQRYPDNDSIVDLLDTHYDRKPERIHETNPGKAMLCSESYIESMDAAWALVEKYPWYVGDFGWTGWDYLGEAAIGHPLPTRLPPPPGFLRDGIGSLSIFGIYSFPWYAAWCGDHDLIGRARPQLRYRQVLWGERPLALMVERPQPAGRKLQAAAWSWYEELPSWSWDVADGTPMTVRVYTRSDRVQLLLDGRVVEEMRLTSKDRCIAAFRLPYRRGTLTAIAWSGRRELGRDTLTTVGAPAGLRLRADVTQLTTRRDDLAHVMVEVVDAQGRLVPDAVNALSLQISGATLAGFANGNPYNVDSFQQPQHWSFHGGALAIVRPPKQTGAVGILASSPGLLPATLSLPVFDA